MRFSASPLSASRRSSMAVAELASRSSKDSAPRRQRRRSRLCQMPLCALRASLRLRRARFQQPGRDVPAAAPRLSPRRRAPWRNLRWRRQIAKFAAQKAALRAQSGTGLATADDTVGLGQRFALAPGACQGVDTLDAPWRQFRQLRGLWLGCACASAGEHEAADSRAANMRRWKRCGASPLRRGFRPAGAARAHLHRIGMRGLVPDQWIAGDAVGYIDVASRALRRRN